MTKLIAFETAKCNSRALRPNYAINPTPELDLRSSRALLPARVIATLGISMRDIGKPALAAAVGATVLVVAFGFVLAGTSYLTGALPGFLCQSLESLVCRAAQGWYVYWWFFYGLFFWPIWAVFFVLLIRRFVKEGKRLAAGGLVLMVVGCFSAVVNLVSLAVGEWSGGLSSGVSWLILDLAMLLMGTRLYFYRAAA